VSSVPKKYIYLCVYIILVCVAWCTRTCDMDTHASCMWVNWSCICVTCLTRVCDMPHSYVCHASFICVTCLIHTCDMPHACVCVRDMTHRKPAVIARSIPVWARERVFVCEKEGVRERWCVCGREGVRKWWFVCEREGVEERWCVWEWEGVIEWWFVCEREWCFLCEREGVGERWCVCGREGVREWWFVCEREGWFLCEREGVGERESLCVSWDVVRGRKREFVCELRCGSWEKERFCVWVKMWFVGEREILCVSWDVVLKAADLELPSIIWKDKVCSRKKERVCEMWVSKLLLLNYQIPCEKRNSVCVCVGEKKILFAGWCYWSTANCR